MEKSYRLLVHYNGEAYQGFQSQKKQNSIQEQLEKALSIFLREKTKIRGASRTDRGVHAHGQVVCFTTKIPFSPRWIVSLNALLPKDIGVSELTEVNSNFHPTYGAKAKIYCYRLWLDRCFDPFIAPFVWQIQGDLDWISMQKEIIDFRGRHDFSAFCSKDSNAKTTIRTILDAKIIRRGPLLEIWIQGDGFLKQMIRIIVGTLVQRAQGKLSKDIPTLIADKKREAAGDTAPANGLCLMHIFYDKIQGLDEYLIQKHNGLTWSCL